MANKPLMEHAIGAASFHKLPWKVSVTSNHSPVRRYYMTRNQVVLAREYLIMGTSLDGFNSLCASHWNNPDVPF